MNWRIPADWWQADAMSKLWAQGFEGPVMDDTDVPRTAPEPREIKVELGDER